MLRTYLQRAVVCLMGDGDAQGIPVDRVGELFAVLNITVQASQLARLKQSFCIDRKDRGRCMDVVFQGSQQQRRTSTDSASGMFTLNDLHWCVLQTLRSAGVHAAVDIRQRLVPFAEAAGGSMPSHTPPDRLWLPLSQLGAFWQSVQGEPVPVEISALAALAASENAAAAQASDSCSSSAAQEQSSNEQGNGATAAAPSGATALRLSEGQVQWLFFSLQNEILNPNHLTVCQPMSLPLTSYCVESSHRTYLTGDQFTSSSDARMYERVLLQGCRFIEVDCWDGAGGEPDVLHGRTLTSRVAAERVFAAIAKTAFVASSYPVVVSIEVHCSIDQQERLAEICRATLGTMLVYPKAGVLAMSPASLQHKVLLMRRVCPQLFEPEPDIAARIKGGVCNAPLAPEAPVPPSQSDTTTATPLPGSMPSTTVLLAAQQRELPFGVGLDDLDDCSSCAIRESNAHHLLHESHSLPLLWSRFNCSNLTRVYPDARRMKSSNYNPFLYWAVGAQLCVLNYQTSDCELQCARGFFRANGGCGYVLKPAALLAADALLANATSPPPPPVALRKLRLTPLCGFLLRKAGEEQSSLDAWAAPSLPLHRPERFEPGASVASPVVSVEVMGGSFAAACADAHSCANGESWESEAVSKNGFNPVFQGGRHGCDIVVSDRQLAVVRVAIYDGSRSQEHLLLGYAALPYHTLRPGVRTVLLQDSHGARLPFSRLLVLLEDGGMVPMPRTQGGGKHVFV